MREWVGCSANGHEVGPHISSEMKRACDRVEGTRRSKHRNPTGRESDDECAMPGRKKLKNERLKDCGVADGREHRRSGHINCDEETRVRKKEGEVMTWCGVVKELTKIAAVMLSGLSVRHGVALPLLGFVTCVHSSFSGRIACQRLVSRS